MKKLNFQKFSQTLLILFAISPFILGPVVFPQKTKDLVRELVPVLANVISTPTPTPYYTKPIRLVVPSISVDAQVEYVGMDEKGRMDVPKNEDNVAWWSPGAKPGEAGNAVLAGHFDRKDGGPAVFYELKSLQVGDEVEMLDEEGKTLRFEVYKTEVFKDAEFPIELVFGPTTEKNLSLITCDGVFDQNAKNYSDRLVVFTRLKQNLPT